MKKDMAPKTIGVTGMWQVGRDNWRSFIFAWSFPILVYLSFVIESLLGPIRSARVLWIDLGFLSVLIVAAIVGVAPYRRRKVTTAQTLFWILLVPVVIFVLLALLPFRFPISITDIPTGPGAGWVKP
jgi:uncharacterized membrane protein